VYTSDRVSATDKEGDQSDKTNVRNPVHAGDSEIAIQWYRTELERSSGSPLGSSPSDYHLLLALNSKAISGNSPSASYSQVATVHWTNADTNRVADAHSELVRLLQKSEAILPSQAQGAGSTGAPTPSKEKDHGTAHRKKKPAPSGTSGGIKSITPKPEREVEVKHALLSAINNLKMNVFAQDNEVQECPFEITLHNIVTLDNMFQPSLGYIARVTDSFYNWIMKCITRPTSSPSPSL
jgi:hypothetical protein